MKFLLIVFTACVCAMPSLAGAVSIYDLIASGRLNEAQDSLSRLATATVRDGDVLFYQSLLEIDADRAAKLMEASLNASVSHEFHEEILFRLAQYHFLKGNTVDMARIINDYRSLFENGRFNREMARLSVVVDEQKGRHELALRQIDRNLVRYSSGDPEQWGSIDKARVLLANNRRIGAIKLLRALTRQSRGPGVPQALYLLAVDANRQGRIDDAVFYYNILREGYPASVGLDILIEQLGSSSHAAPSDNAADKLTGTYYSVKVGVFSNKGNAKKQRDTFKPYDKKTEIRTKNISGKEYHVVYVGTFSSFEEARQFKATLEANHNEVYQVVAR